MRMSTSGLSEDRETKVRSGAGGQDLVARLMTDMSPELLEFIQTKVDSFTKWDLIRFFHENPHVTGTAEYIAWRAGREPGTLQAELAELAAQGILVETQLLDQMKEKTFYSLSYNKRIRGLIRRFVEASADRQFRAKVIYHIIRHMREGLLLLM